MIIHTDQNKSRVSTTLCRKIMSVLEVQVNSNDVASLALSGGSTPQFLYQLLGKKLRDTDILPRVLFLQVDERFVPPTHPRSNQTMILEKINLPSMKFIKIPTIEKNSEIAAQVYEEQLTTILSQYGKPSPDCILLGMGEDGHTASLFPNNPSYVSQLKHPQKKVIGLHVSHFEEDRISMTSKFINQFSKKFLLIFGKEKAVTLATAINSQDFESYPILSVLQETEIYTTEQDAMIIRQILE